MSDSKDQTAVQTSPMEYYAGPEDPRSDPPQPKQEPAVTVAADSPQEGSENGGSGNGASGNEAAENETPESETAADQMERRKGFWGYFKTKEFYITLLLGQIMAITNTGSSTLTTLLRREGTSIPAFQTFFNYFLLNVIFTPYTMYRYGFKGWLRLVWYSGWKYIILAFCDVEGNYFIVLAYQYTTILSAQLINFWAIAVVVVISFLFLKVRYHITQVTGILICIGGVGVLIASDHVSGASGNPNVPQGEQVKGDMFALLGASFYGLTNTAEEYFVSKRPVYEVLGQLAFFAMIINGVQAGIFDRDSFRNATWNADVGGYLVGYTLCLTLFYCMAPLLFRLSSAAFFNISLLTMNFWGVVIGIEVLNLHIHWMYPIAFVLIIVGQLIYFLGRRLLGEARKPWLGRNQERGIAGIFTAKKKIELREERTQENENADNA